MDYPKDFQRLCKFPRQKGLEAGGFKKFDVRAAVDLQDIVKIFHQTCTEGRSRYL